MALLSVPLALSSSRAFDRSGPRPSLSGSMLIVPTLIRWAYNRSAARQAGPSTCSH